MCKMTSPNLLLCLIGSLSLFGNNGSLFASARVNCTVGDPDLGDSYCVEKYRSGSVCATDGFCSNPFQRGCLRTVDEKMLDLIRVCNSDDDPEAASRGDCEIRSSEFEEVRILIQDWESPIFTSWIMQILLSEYLNVPTTLETGKPDTSSSFYDPEMRFEYGSTGYDYDAIRRSLEHGGCESFRKEQQKIADNNAPYESCGDVIPEAWYGQNANIETHVKDGLLEPSTGSGGVGKYSWYVPKFTAVNNYIVLSLYGIKEGTLLEQRRRMAELFLRPRNWKFFCDEVSEDNCTTSYIDEEGRLIASRPPEGEDEEGKFFSEGLYHGHFSASEENDCDANPTNCTGHIASPPCEWTNFVVPQSHYMGIPVRSSGKESASGNYNYGQMVGIYKAANYTKSNVLFYWFRPDPTTESFMGTDAEFTPVLLRHSTVECQQSRVNEQQRCSENPADWIGEEAGACDSETDPVQKLVVANMYNRTINGNDRLSRSPAYRFIKGFRLSDLHLELMYRRWYAMNKDRWSYDHRETVCAWVGENIEVLSDFIPETYPRTVRKIHKNSQALSVAMALSVITTVLVLSTAACTYHYRSQKVMIYAQPVFLYIILSGILFQSIGALLRSLPPFSGTCMVTEWFITLGYSLVLVPLIVKVSAINKLFQSAAKFKRVKITPVKLYKIIGGINGGVVLFLIVWSVLDPFTATKEVRLTGDPNGFGGEWVEMYDSCSTKQSFWYMVVFVYNILLCVAATVLAVQTRNVKQEFNESIRLGHVVYATFLTQLLLVLIYMLGPSNSSLLKPTTAAAISSFLLNANIIVMLAVYFFPKIITARKPQATYRDSQGFSSALSNPGSSTSLRRKSVSLTKSSGIELFDMTGTNNVTNNERKSMVSNSNAEPNNKDGFSKEKSISNKRFSIERVDMIGTINDTNNERKIMVSNSNGEPNDKDGDDSHSSSGQQEE